MFYIYKITNKINNKMYIGKTDDIDQRWKEHLNAARLKKNMKHLYVFINEHGEENFIIEKIEDCETEILSFNRERFWIKELKSNNLDIGMNRTAGGQGTSGYKWSKESCDKIRGKNHYNFGKKLSFETKEKLSKSLSGEKNGFFGKKHTDKTIEFLKNREITDEFRYKCGDSNRGEGSYKTKLTEHDVIEIRKKWDNKEFTQTQIAEQYGVKPNTISNIVNRKRWTHI